MGRFLCFALKGVQPAAGNIGMGVVLLMKGEAERNGGAGKREEGGGGAHPWRGVVGDVGGPQGHAELKGNDERDAYVQGLVSQRERKDQNNNIYNKFYALPSLALAFVGAEGGGAQLKGKVGRKQKNAGQGHAGGSAFDIVLGKGPGVMEKVCAAQSLTAHEHQESGGGQGQFIKDFGEVQGAVGAIVHQRKGREKEESGEKGAWGGISMGDAIEPGAQAPEKT